MKKIFTIISVCLLLASCAKFTDLKPKGMNLLSTAEELELLLNEEYTDFVGGTGAFDMLCLTGDIITTRGVPNILSAPTPSRAALILKWDETNLDKFAETTTTDIDYSKLYGYIGRIANPILTSVGYATGDEAKKNQIKAEALCLRAWAHLLLVSKYAPAYNPATAESDPGIVYLMDDWDITIPPEKWTVKDVYDQIVADCQAAIDLKSLPDKNINQMRWSKDCAYAIKALALMAMQKFDDAEEAAKLSLKVNDAIADYWSEKYTQQVVAFGAGIMTPAVFRPLLACEEDMFHTKVLLNFSPLRTPEAERALEPGHTALVRMPEDYMLFMAPMAAAQYGLPYSMVWDMNQNSSWNLYGLKTTQQYLIVAECEIRKNNIDEAMKYLDYIRVKRINPDMYAPLKGAVTAKEEAIANLKQTALGENLFSVYNFIERKRWNQLDDMKETIVKNLLGETYTLTPDSKYWIFPFPANARDNNEHLTLNWGDGK